MHKSMTPDVIKRLVVSIKKMEQDLAFYENNWELFTSSNLEYNKGIIDETEVDKELEMMSGR